MTVRARPYRSPLRAEQARATRHRIVDAGRELFVERGYGPTTIDAIAERAGVSRKTVFTSVGGKAAVLKLAFDWTLAGDDEPVAIADRPDVRTIMTERDPTVLVDAWAAMSAAIAARVAALHHVLVVAADTDADAAALLSSVDQQRAAGGLAFVTRLHGIGGLRPSLEPARASAIADVLMDPLPYRRLVQLHGWTTAEYTEYLQQAAAAALLPPGISRPRRTR
ncbi:MAG TPA: helix-turn-helix domain-containing protein [Acidimicrobiales bacterium]